MGIPLKGYLNFINLGAIYQERCDQLEDHINFEIGKSDLRGDHDSKISKNTLLAILSMMRELGLIE